MTELINNKIKKIQASSYNSSLRSHPSELAEVRNILNIASKTLPGHKIYFENMIEKAEKFAVESLDPAPEEALDDIYI